MIQLPSNISKLRNAWRIANDIPDPHGVSCFKVTNAGSVSKFYVTGIIGMDDEDSSGFTSAVHSVTDKNIELYINSPGGFVFDAVSMYDALTNSPANVDVYITGLAASAASFLAMAGNSVKIAEPGRMMIHDAQGIAIGSPADVREYADLLDNVSDDISAVYAKRAGGEPKAWRKAMSATTWYSSSQAIESKLADGLTSGDKGPDNRTKLIQARARVLISQKGK